jgi:hypothetical protein
MLNEACLEFLKELPSPIGIIAVAGMYRTGKSYLLNRMLLNRQNGFGVGPTINACTKVPYLNHVRRGCGYGGSQYRGLRLTESL